MALDIFWTVFLVVANGFFVAAEFAIVKVRASQIELQAKSGSNVAKIAKNITLDQCSMSPGLVHCHSSVIVSR